MQFLAKNKQNKKLYISQGDNRNEKWFFSCRELEWYNNAPFEQVCVDQSEIRNLLIDNLSIWNLLLRPQCAEKIIEVLIFTVSYSLTLWTLTVYWVSYAEYFPAHFKISLQCNIYKFCYKVWNINWLFYCTNSNINQFFRNINKLIFEAPLIFTLPNLLGH